MILFVPRGGIQYLSIEGDTAVPPSRTSRNSDVLLHRQLKKIILKNSFHYDLQHNYSKSFVAIKNIHINTFNIISIYHKDYAHEGFG